MTSGPVKPGNGSAPPPGEGEQKKAEQPASPEGAPAAPPAPERKGPDGFEDKPSRKKKLVLDPRPSAPPPRGRILDPTLIPLVPAHSTTDPARQYHALLGLPPQLRKAAQEARAAAEKAAAEKAAPPRVDLEPLLARLPAPRVKLLRQVLAGSPDAPPRKRLDALVASPDFLKLDEEGKRKALSKVDLRPK